VDTSRLSLNSLEACKNGALVISVSRIGHDLSLEQASLT
jgi:hypothetical protein